MLTLADALDLLEDLATSPYYDMDLLWDDDIFLEELSAMDYAQPVDDDVTVISDCEDYADTVNTMSDRFAQLVINALQTNKVRGLLVQHTNTLVLDDILHVSTRDFNKWGSVMIPEACESAFEDIHRRLVAALIQLYKYVSMRTPAARPTICFAVFCDDSFDMRACNEPFVEFGYFHTLCCCEEGGDGEEENGEEVSVS
jgi:hypothetical protein